LKIKILLLSLILISCGKLVPLTNDIDTEGNSGLLGKYLLDSESGGLFEKNSWFTYYFAQHSSITTLDVYSLKSKNKYYKMQIVEFYKDNDNTKLGYYTLRLSDETSEMKLVEVDAHACGHPQGNPDFDECVRTDKNRYAYLTLSDQSVRYLSDLDAQSDLEWDIAFKADAIKLNSGLSGPGSVSGAILSQNLEYVTGDDQVRFDKLFTALASDKDLSRYQSIYNPADFFYYGADGVNRVVYEKFWYNEVSGVRSAISNNWWIIRNSIGSSFSKFNIESINENQNVDGVIETKITFNVHTQEEGEVSFPLAPRKFTLDLKSNKRKIFCLDLNAEVSLTKCSKNTLTWDIRFISNKREWSIETRNGARGPLPIDVVLDITNG
jgi:hypothetical protein